MSEIDIRIRSTLNDEGITRAIQSIHKLREQLQGLNSAFKASSSGRGVSAMASDADKAAKKVENVAETFQQSARSIAGDAQRIIASFEKISQSFAPFDQGFHRRIEALVKFEKQLRSVDQAAEMLSQAQGELNEVVKRGAADVERVAQAQNNFSQAVRTAQQAVRGMEAQLMAAEKVQRKYSEGLAKVQGAADDLEAALSKMSSDAEGYDEALEQWIRLNEILVKAEKAAAASSKGLADAQEQLTQVSKRAQQIVEDGIRGRARLRQVTQELTRAENEWIRAQQKAARQPSTVDAQRQAELTELRNAILQRYRLRDTIEQERARQAAQLNRQYWLEEEAAMRRRNEALRSAILARYSSQPNIFERIANSMIRFTSGSAAATRAVFQTATSLQRVTAGAHQAAQAIASVVHPVLRLAQALLGGLVRGAHAATNALGAFSRMVVTRFAGAMRTISAAGGAIARFGQQAFRGFRQAREGMEFYAAGWSMLMAGNSLRFAAGRGFSLLFGGLEDYTQYERGVIRTAIAGSMGGIAADPALVQELVFGIQRGAYGAQPVYQFSPQELAQGAYYFASALGIPITRESLPAISRSLAPILQMAAFTQTQPETAIKGVLNVAMEFGYDPRDMKQAEQLARIAGQLGYLANISTMEVTDILETFKMGGTMFHALAGPGAGTGLEEMMAITFLASEVGLRGSAVGRGVQRVLSTLLSPTEKVEELTRQVFGGSVRDVFFDERGYLKGGFEGFFMRFADPSLGPKAAELLAEFFTENATRAMVGAIEGLRGDPERFRKIIHQLIAGDAEEALNLLDSALATTNDTIFGYLQNLRNAWFQMYTSIIDSIKGPLKSALQLLANIFFEVGDAIRRNPFFGRLIAGSIAFVSGILALAGALLTFAGVILVLGRALRLVHGVGRLFLTFIAAIPHFVLIVLPTLAALAAAVILLRRAWEENFLGIRNIVERLRGDFSGNLEAILVRIEAFIRAFANIFARGVNRTFDQIVARARSWRETFVQLLTVLKNVAEGVAIGFGLTLRAMVALADAAFERIGRALQRLSTTSAETARTIGIVFGVAFTAVTVYGVIPFHQALEKLVGQLLRLSFAALAAIAPFLGAVAVFTAVAAAIWYTSDRTESFFTVLKELATYFIGGFATAAGVLIGFVLAVGTAVVTALEKLNSFLHVFDTWNQVFFVAGAAVAAFLLAPLAIAAIKVTVVAGLIVAAIMMIGAAINALTGSDYSLGEWINKIGEELQRLVDILSFSDIPLEEFGRRVEWRIGQMLDLLGIAIFSQVRNFVEGLGDAVAKYTGLQWVFSQIGVPFDPSLGKAVDPIIESYKARFNEFQAAIDEQDRRIAAQREARLRELSAQVEAGKRLSIADEFRRQLATGDFDLGAILDSLTREITNNPKLAEAKAAVMDQLGLSGKDPLKLSWTDLVDISGGGEEFWQEFKDELKSAGITLDDLIAAGDGTAIMSEVDKLAAKLRQEAEKSGFDWVLRRSGAADGFYRRAAETIIRRQEYQRILEEEAKKFEQEQKERIERARVGIAELGPQMPSFASMLAAATPRSALAAPTLGHYLGLNAESINQFFADVAQKQSEELGYEVKPADLFSILFGSTTDITKQANMHGKQIAKAIYQDQGLLAGLQARGVTPEQFVDAFPFAYAADPAVVEMVKGQLLTGLTVAQRQALLEASIEPNDLAEWIASNIGNPEGWNLAHYLMESQGVDYQTAHAILKGLGLDDLTISSDTLFKDLEGVIVDGWGRIVGLSSEQLSRLPKIVEGPLGKTMHLTEQEFNRIPDFIKAALIESGVTFQIETGIWAKIWEGKVKNLSSLLKRGIEVSFQDLDMDGILDAYVIDPITGTRIPLPDVELPEGYKEHVQELIKSTFGDANVPVKIDIIPPEVAADDPGLVGDATGIVEAAGAAVITPLTEYIQQQVDTAVKATKLDISEAEITGGEEAGKKIAQEVADGFTAEISSSLSQSLTNVTFTANQTGGAATGGPFDAAFRGYAAQAAAAFVSALRTNFQGINLASLLSAQQGTAQGGAATGSGPFDLAFSAYAVLAAAAFKNTLDTDLDTALTNLFDATASPFDSTFSTYGTSAAIAFQQAFNVAFTNWTPSFVPTTTAPNGSQDPALQNVGATPSGQTTYTVKIELDTSSFDPDFEWVTKELNLYFGPLKIWTTKLTLDLTQFDADFNSVAESLNNYDAATLTADLDVNTLAAFTKVNNMILFMYEYATTWTATLSVVDNATWVVQSLINKLNQLPSSKTVTIYVNEVTTATSNVRGQFASGGLVPVPGMYLVGEQGPELVRLPGGARVYDNSELRRMAASASYGVQAASTASAGEQESGGTTIIFNGDMHFYNQTDIKMLVEEIDRLQGRKNRTAARGMVPVDLATLYSTT